MAGKAKGTGTKGKAKGAKATNNPQGQATQGAQAPVPGPAKVVPAPVVPKANRKGNSKVAYPVAVAWVVCYNLQAQAQATGAPAPTRKTLMAGCINAGVTYNTARTQVQAYLKATKGATQAPATLPTNVQLG